MKFPCILLLGLFISLGISNAQNNNRTSQKEIFRVAVYEIKQYDDKTSGYEDIINRNLESYIYAATVAKENEVEFMVFPEKGLFPMKTFHPTWFLSYAEDVPDGEEKANPCNDEKFSNSPILRNFSCIAKNNNFFIAAALIDKKECEVHESCENRTNKNSCVTSIFECPITGHFYFNTQVIIDNKGTVIVRYYKRHPFFFTDLLIATPRYPQPTQFETTFGVFDLIIGFDAVFDTVVNDVKEHPEITGISYANWWFDHTPLFYFGVPIQQATSMVNNVTVFSSDVQAPNTGSLGSGIYVPGKGAIIYSYNPDGRSKLLIADVPTLFPDTPLNHDSLFKKFLYINPNNSVEELNGEEPRDFKEECSETLLGIAIDPNEYRCKDSKVDQYTFVKLNKTEDYISICSNGFCCSLEYEAETMNETFYFAVSGNRLKFYQVYYFGVQSCFLARCEPVDGKPCRNFLLKSNTKFKSFKMIGDFNTTYVYPHMLDSDLRLTNTDEYQFDLNQLSYENKYGENLLFANMYGRKYEKDDLTWLGKVVKFIMDHI